VNIAEQDFIENMESLAQSLCQVLDMELDARQDLSHRYRQGAEIEYYEDLYAKQHSDLFRQISYPRIKVEGR
jgi:flagellar biosynthesis/type III secretory pathway chaperone